MYIKQGSHTNISAYVQSVAHAALYFWVINKLSSDPFFYDFFCPFFTKPFFFVIVWLFKNWYWVYHHFLCTFFNLYWFIGKRKGLWKLFFVRNERGPKCQLDCTLWHYGLLSFQSGGTKLEILLPINICTQRKFLNSENWTNGEPQ